MTKEGILSYLVRIEEGRRFHLVVIVMSVECARDGRFVFFLFHFNIFISITHGRKEMADSISFGCYGPHSPKRCGAIQFKRQNQYVIQNVSLNYQKNFV